MAGAAKTLPATAARVRKLRRTKVMKGLQLNCNKGRIKHNKY